MLAEVEGADSRRASCCRPTGRGTATWRVEELDKVGYRGVESAAYHFDGHHAPGAEILGGDGRDRRGARQMLDALDVGRVNVACRALGIIDRALALRASRSPPAARSATACSATTRHAQMRIGEMRARRAAVEALIERAAAAVDAGDDGAARAAPPPPRWWPPTAAVWAVDRAARLAASRSYAADDELARLRRDAPQTQIGEGANDALLMAMGKGLIKEAVRGPARVRPPGEGVMVR